MRCLVTGHQGYIGGHLVEKLREKGHVVVGVDFANDPQQNLLYCLENNPYYASFQPEYIFHLACIPRVAYSVANPVSTMQNNVIATTKVLDFARKVRAKRVVYSGSSSVIGDGNGPNSPYGLQKLISEMECKLYSELYNLDTVTLRYFNVYSPDQKAEGAYATAVSNFMQHIRDKKEPFITGNGEQRRDMANVKDVVSANIFAMEHESDFDGKYFDIGTGDNISLNEIAKIVNKHFPHVQFSYVEPRGGDVLYTKADMSPMKDIGWKPKIGILEGVEECFIKLKQEIKRR